MPFFCCIHETILLLDRLSDIQCLLFRNIGERCNGQYIYHKGPSIIIQLHLQFFINKKALVTELEKITSAMKGSQLQKL